MNLQQLVYENVHMIDLWLTNKAYLSDITVTNISQSFTYKMAIKINWHRYETIITSLSPYVWAQILNSTQVNFIFFRQTMNSSKRAKVSDICLTGGVIADIPHYQATTKSFKDTVKSNRETGRS